MGEVVRLTNNSIGDMLTKMERLYNNGDIEGMVVGIKLRSGEFICGFTHSITFLEQLGLCQALINDIQYAANEG